MKNTAKRAAIALSALLFSVNVFASDLEDLMKQIGSNFNDLKKIVLVNKSLGADAKEKSQTLSGLFYQALPIVPDLDKVSNDPAQQERLLVLYRRIMSETLAASYETELQIVQGDMLATTKGIELLSAKRKEAHDLFKK